MQVAIASGKGGTGKTTVATSLAYVAAQSGTNVRLIDCDVEEPNCHIFLDPEITSTVNSSIDVPEVDDDACTACGLCAELCEYGAITIMKEKVLTFTELCHSCTGCWRVCPVGAISRTPRELGVMEDGRANGFAFRQGRLRVGEAMSVPLIRQLKADDGDEELTLLDSPPGTSCPVVTAVRDVDYVCLVTEPTPFGLSDLEMAVEMVAEIGQRAGVIINRADIGDDRVSVFCAERGIPVLAEIPDDRRIAESYSRGKLIAEVLPEYARVFETLLQTIRQEVSR